MPGGPRSTGTGMGTRTGAGSRNAGIPSPPRQHILNITKSQHSMGLSQSHMPSHCPGSNFRFCFYSFRGAFFFGGGASDSPSDADITTSASAAVSEDSKPKLGTAAGLGPSNPARTYSRNASHPTE